MGVSATSLRNTFTESQEETKKQFDDTMNGLTTMANDKMAKFYEDIEGGLADTKLLPMKFITGKFTFVQVTVAEDSATLSSQISKLIGDLAGGHWADAISDTAADIISGILGNSDAAVTQRQTYAVSMNSLGGVQRLDALYIAYSFTSQTMIKTAQNMVACMVVKSSVDCTHLDDNTLRIIVDDSFPSTSNVDKAKLYEDLAQVVLNPGPTDKQIAASKALEAYYAQSNPSSQGGGGNLVDNIHKQT